MKPHVTEVLAFMAKNIPTYLPEIEPAFLRGRLSSVVGVVAMLAEDIDRGVPRRIEENQAFRALFREGAAIVTDKALAQRLADEGARPSDADLRLSALDSDNDRLRGLLIELHAHVEARDDKPAHDLNEAIWEELKRSTERRKRAFANF
jgi:hypothetical protein